MPLLQPWTPAQLVQGVTSGNPEAIAALCRQYGSSVRRKVRRVMGLDAEVEDLVQDVFVQVLEGAIKNIRNPNHLEAFLGGIAVKLCLKKRRWKRLRAWIPLHEIIEPEASANDDAASEAIQRLYAILDNMNEKNRTVYVLHRIDGQELIDVANFLEISYSSVKRYLDKAEKIVQKRAANDPVLTSYVQPLRPESNTNSERLAIHPSYSLSVQHRTVCPPRS